MSSIAVQSHPRVPGVAAVDYVSSKPSLPHVQTFEKLLF